LVTGEEVSRGKPDPEGFLAAAEKLGVEPTGTVVIEDAPAGVRAAKAAGMMAVAVGTTHAREQLAEADAFVATLEHVRVRASADRSPLTVVTSSD
jgi:mannitol-1-/sugar-/sorbitol-6-phosphatase